MLRAIRTFPRRRTQNLLVILKPAHAFQRRPHPTQSLCMLLKAAKLSCRTLHSHTYRPFFQDLVSVLGLTMIMKSVMGIQPSNNGSLVLSSSGKSILPTSSANSAPRTFTTKSGCLCVPRCLSHPHCVREGSPWPCSKSWSSFLVMVNTLSRTSPSGPLPQKYTVAQTDVVPVKSTVTACRSLS